MDDNNPPQRPQDPSNPSDPVPPTPGDPIPPSDPTPTPGPNPGDPMPPSEPIPPSEPVPGDPMVPEPEPIREPEPTPAPQPSTPPNTGPAGNWETPPTVSTSAVYSNEMTVSQDEKTQAILCWVLSIFIGFISPLIFYFVGKDKPFVFHHAAQCLTVHIVVIVLWVITFILSFVCIGLLLIPVVALYPLIMGIMGAIKASNGEYWDVPFTGKLSRSWFKA